MKSLRHVLTNRHKPTLQENVRAFRFVGIFLAFVTAAYIVIALLVFGHL
jgi:hypothetical protein